MIINRQQQRWVRKTHRFLGLFMGLQFLMWTVSGLYFSWSDIDQIHGDDFKKSPAEHVAFDLPVLDAAKLGMPVHALSLRTIDGEPYYWINDSILVEAYTGQITPGINKDQAVAVAQAHLKPLGKIDSVYQIEAVGPHHEVRGADFPVYAIAFQHPDHPVAYVSQKDGRFLSIRHQNWRWFDFLWMTHTMDYEGRDDFNTTLLRAFSFLGLITVLSGFALWAVTTTVFKRKNAQ